MKRLLLTLAAVAALGGALAACETATPYQPLTPGNAQAGGYSEQKINDDLWRVTFSGNSLTSRETVERYLMYRAAELTASQGGDWFLDNHRATDKNTSYQVDPFYATGPGFAYGWGWRPYWSYYGGGFGWRGYDPWFGGPWGPEPFDVTQITRYQASAEIRIGKGPKPANAIDAREALANLGPAIVRPQPAH
jgi:hypothetical protein